jgi:phytoene synthase
MAPADELNTECRQVIARGSKSFAFASLFLEPPAREGASLLYAWCRHCDDVTDGSILGFGQSSRGLPADRVARLKEWTLRAFRGETDRLDPPFLAMARVARRHAIPEVYALDLLDGMERDASGSRFEDIDALQKYCYQVAGTVGLMMCSVMGLKDPRALQNAVDLGIALQLTNIVRDIGDDFRAGRVYVPLRWLKQEGIDEERLMEGGFAAARMRIARQLLVFANDRYASGMRGLRDLPWRAALAVAIAAQVYRGIGAKVLRTGPSAWEGRVSLSRLEKAQAALSGLAHLLKTVPSRFLRRRPVQPVSQIWRFE